MLYFTLPCFYENFIINNFLQFLNKHHSSFFKEKIVFIQTSGTFPYLSWNGGYNSNQGNSPTYQDFYTCGEKNCLPLRINCANIFLEDFDFFDSMGQAILQANHNGSNLISISNLHLMELIEEKYPNYKFVLSREADLITPFTSNMINLILETDIFNLIEIPERLNSDFQFFNDLNKKNKIEIIVNPCCPKTCKNIEQCKINNHINQLQYSKQDTIKSCIKHYPLENNQVLTLTELKQKYLPLGINHFTFNPYINNKNSDLILFYLKYFIKEEFLFEALTLWRKVERGEKI